MNRISVGTTLLLLVSALAVASPGVVAAGESAQAGPDGGFTADQVSAAVETWVRHVTADARPDATVERLEPFVVGGETVAYIAHLAGGGFCLAGEDPRVLPVYFYSPRGSFDPANPSLEFLLDEIAARRAWGRAAAGGDLTPSQRTRFAGRRALWDALIEGQAPPRVSALASGEGGPASLKLPLTSTWHQGSPYNDRLPELTPGAGEHVKVGCNATATAQLMNYWEWPPTGVGSGSVDYEYRYRITPPFSVALAACPAIPADFAGRLSYDPAAQRLRMSGYWDDSIHDRAVALAPDDAPYQAALALLWSAMFVGHQYPGADFGATTYDWSLLKDTHADPADIGNAEVAKLNAHVAIAVNSGLGAWGTGSSFVNDAEALRDHFRYDPDALATPSQHAGGAGPDIDSMTEEIQWGRPAGLGGANLTNGGGHAWLVLGYDKGTDPNRQFWMNVGAGGYLDGWHTFDDVALFPDYQDMMTRVAPSNVKFVGASGAGDGSPSNPYRDIEEALGSAPNGSTLIFKAGSVNQFAAATLVIARPLVLKGWGVTVTK
jgi:hypothetical protein